MSRDVTKTEGFIVAIDGPSASGKGTIASRVAGILGFHYLESGALYRLVALVALREGLEDEGAIAKAAEGMDVSFLGEEIFLEDQEVSLQVRHEQVGTRASEVATLESGGSPADCLLDAVAAEQATLVAVGSHGLGRATGALLGSVATKVLHRAPCSVLVTRGHAEGSWSPGKIVVGVDESPAAEAALRACRALESRFGSEVTPLTVAGRRPGHGLVEAAAEADLLAVGNRADRRPFGLGSVAENVAHHARCSVLVVRETIGAS